MSNKISDEAVAAICHEANRMLCQSLGDVSQPAWHNAPEWQVTSALYGVRKIRSGEVTRPEQSHESWLAHKQADGWVYGEVKNPEKREHPCMVAFDKLPSEQQAKDRLFFAIVTALS